jgi:hypothetical protein
MALKIYQHEQPTFTEKEKVVTNKIEEEFIQCHGAKKTEFTGGLISNDNISPYHFEAPIHDTKLPKSGRDMSRIICDLSKYCDTTADIHKYGRGYFESESILPNFYIQGNPNKDFDGTPFPLKILKRVYAANYPLISILRRDKSKAQKIIDDSKHPLYDERIKTVKDLIDMKRRSFKEAEIHVTFPLKELLENTKNAAVVEELENAGFYLTTIMNWDANLNPTEEVCVATLAGPKKYVYPVYRILKSYLAEVGGVPYEIDLEFAKTAMIIGDYDEEQENNGLGEMNGIAFPPMARFIIDNRLDCRDERWRWGSSQWLDCKNDFYQEMITAKKCMENGEEIKYHVHLDGLNQNVLQGERLGLQAKLFDEFFSYATQNNIPLTQDDLYVDKFFKLILRIN